MKWPLEEDAYETTIEQLEAGTKWRWVTISPDLHLTLTLDSDDPEMIARVEESAKANGIALERIPSDD